MFNGTLPSAWGKAGYFGSVICVDLSSNQLSGTLPGGWLESLGMSEFTVSYTKAISNSEKGKTTAVANLPMVCIAYAANYCPSSFYSQSDAPLQIGAVKEMGMHLCSPSTGLVAEFHWRSWDTAGERILHMRSTCKLACTYKDHVTCRQLEPGLLEHNQSEWQSLSC